MKIKVTQEHIDQGKRCSPTQCPVALALYPQDVTVGATLITINAEVFNIPPAAQRSILEFDFGKDIRPFEFELK